MSFSINSSSSSLSFLNSLSSIVRKMVDGISPTVRAELALRLKQNNEKELDQRRIKAISFKSFPNFIQALAWPEVYNELDLLDASLLHLMQMLGQLREQNSLVSKKTQALLLSLISTIDSTSHRAKPLFEHFLVLTKKELSTEQCRTFKLLSCLFHNSDVTHLKIGTIAKITSASPVASPDLESMRVQGLRHFTDTLLSLLRNTNEKINEFLETRQEVKQEWESFFKIRRLARSPYLLTAAAIGHASTEAMEPVYRRMEQLRKSYLAKKNNFTVHLEIIAKHLKQSSPQASVSIVYALNNISSDTDRVKSSILRLYADINALYKGIRSFLPEEECTAIDGEITLSLKDTCQESLQSVADRLETNVSRLATNISLTPSAGLGEGCKGFLKIFGEIAYEGSKAISRKEELEKERKVREKRDLEIAKLEKQGGSAEVLRVSWRTSYCRFFSLKTHLETCFDGLIFLKKHAMALKVQREALQKEAPIEDLDTLWPLLHDHIEETVEPLNAELAAKEEEVQENEETSPVMPSSSSASSVLITRTCMQQLEPLCRSIQRFHKLEQARMPALRLRLRDATYHLETFGATCDLFKHCVEGGLKEFLPILLKRLVRNSAIMSEQLLTVEALVKNPSSVSSHSHLQLEQGIKWLNTLTTLEDAQQKRLREYLQQVEYGTVFHRYPHDTLEMCQYHRWPVPLALNWILYPERTPLPEMIEFIENSLLLVETMVTSPVTTTLSTTWKKELAAAVASPSMSQTLRHPSTPLDGKLQELIQLIEGRIKRCDNRTPIGKKTVLAFQEVHSHAIGLQQSLFLGLLFPSKCYLISHGDAILMNLQFLDEQLEMALHMERTGQALRMHHDLQAYRALREAQESSAHSSLIDNLNVKIGAQYPHLQQAANRAAQTRSPSGILWRLHAVEVSRYGDAYDAGMTPAHRSSSVNPENLFKELLEMIEGMCEITRLRLT